MTFGTGAYPDDDDDRDRRYLAKDLVGGTFVRTKAMDLLTHVYIDPVLGWLNQLSGETCVGFAWCQTLYTYLHSLGSDAPMGSPLALHFHGAARGVGWDHVTNDGIKPRNALESTRELGLVPFDKWPRKGTVRTWEDMAALVAKQPDPACYREAIDMDWLRYHWIKSFGAEREYDVKQTLSAKRPIALTLTVDDSFQDWTLDKGAWKRTRDVRGYHYVAAVGYEPAGLWIANSYGSGFGQLGYALISWDTIRSGETRSLAVPDVNLDMV
jgi:hypothetical protein